MNRTRLLVYATALSTMVGWSLIAPQPAQAQLLPPLPIGSLIVTVTSPADGSPVSGTVPVSASVTIIGSLTVRGVQFKLDGANLGAQDTSAPYSVPWNTTTASNGSHTLTAVATDLLGGTWTSDPVPVTVFNATTPPSVPTGLTATAVSSSQINLSWTASSDNVGVSGYRVYRGGTQIATRSTTSFANTGLSASTTYSYTVAAYDAAGNLSAQSSSASATTPAPPDITPPSVTINQAAGQADPTSASPINFTAVFSEPVSGFTGAGVTISGTAAGTKTVTVSGGPSTYNVAVSGMSSAGTVIASIPAGVASDAAGNLNTASTSTDNSVSFTPADTTPPSVTINQAPGQADPTNSSPINFSAVFSEPVSGLTGAAVTHSGSAGGTKTVTVSGGPSTYNVAVSGMSSAGTVIASIPAGVARDAANNANTASTSTDNSVTFTLVSPVVLENQQPGSGNWQMWLRGIAPADDVNKQIKGYASATSVNKGGSIT